MQTKRIQIQSRFPSLRSSGRTRGSGIIRCRKPGILAKIELRIHFNGQSDSSLKRIIPEPHVPSRGSQARGTRLARFSLSEKIGTATDSPIVSRSSPDLFRISPGSSEVGQTRSSCSNGRNANL
jgi:hypothetical protein